MLNFDVQVAKEKNIPIIRVKGEIDIYTCPKLNEALSDSINAGNKGIILNLENISYIDSTGLGAIAQSARALNATNGQLYIVCNQPQIRKIFEVSGLDKKNIRLFDKEEVALGAVT